MLFADTADVVRGGFLAYLWRLVRWVVPIYQPPYSPHRDRTERVWKFVKKAALADRSFPDSPALKAAIDATLDELGPAHEAAMATLLTLRFETLQKASGPTA